MQELLKHDLKIIVSAIVSHEYWDWVEVKKIVLSEKIYYILIIKFKFGKLYLIEHCWDSLEAIASEARWILYLLSSILKLRKLGSKRF